jgi:hypothetical protein
MKSKTVKQFLFIFNILLNVLFFILIIDVIQGLLSNNLYSFATGVPCSKSVLIWLSLALTSTLFYTYILFKDESFE